VLFDVVSAQSAAKGAALKCSNYARSEEKQHRKRTYRISNMAILLLSFSTGPIAHSQIIGTTFAAFLGGGEVGLKQDWRQEGPL
jgi:hypothetical protein